MVGKKEQGDPRLHAARYRVDKLSGADSGTAASAAAQSGNGNGPDGPDAPNTAGQSMMEQRAHYVETVIQQAMRRGDFDNLPGAGKPLKNLTQVYEPDWWIRQKIEAEKLSGLGPPALTLKTEDAQLESRLDAALSESDVRELLEEFNARVTAARRQLQGGPPVVTPLRDIDAEISGWRQRRAARHQAAAEARRQEAAHRASLGWNARRRAKRDRRE